MVQNFMGLTLLKSTYTSLLCKDAYYLIGLVRYFNKLNTHLLRITASNRASKNKIKKS